MVLEGYNESLQLGSADGFMAGLRRQTVLLSEVQVILVGSEAQCEHWRLSFGSDPAFHSIRTIAASGAHYYMLKNRGLREAVGECVVLADTDLVPHPGWLAAIDESFREGADVSAGLSGFFSGSETHWPRWMLDLAASISWGFILGERDGRSVDPRGFLSHNVAMRREIAQRYLYPEEFGRTCAGSLLFAQLMDDGVRVVLNPRQRVFHVFDFRWWVGKLHARLGYEVFRLRRLGSRVVDARASRLGLLEPLLTMLWHVAADVPQWFRYRRWAGWSLPGAVLALPFLLGLSCAARGSEMLAMYRTIAAPEAMERFALRS